MELSRTDYSILKTLVNENATNHLESMTLKEIMNIMKTSRPTTYRKMIRLKELGYVEKGCKSVQADTFYILPKGISIVKNKGEIYGKSA